MAAMVCYTHVRMLKALNTIFLLIAGLFLASFVTLIPWNIQIEHRAFRCTDDMGFGTFFCDMYTHRGAGDTISPGWTWEELELVREAYETAFFAIWLSLPTGYLLILRRNRRKNSDLNRSAQQSAGET